jgi:hypothetical protein
MHVKKQTCLMMLMGLSWLACILQHINYVLWCAHSACHASDVTA